jgi:hypothetical protein
MNTSELIGTPGSDRISRKGTSQKEGLPPAHHWILKTRPAAGTARGRMTGGTGAQDAAKTLERCLRSGLVIRFDLRLSASFQLRV